MIRNIVIHISSQRSDPTEVAWSVRESSWSVGKQSDSLMGSGTFPTPSGGLTAVLLDAVAAVQACAEARARAELLVAEARARRA